MFTSSRRLRGNVCKPHGMAGCSQPEAVVTGGCSTKKLLSQLHCTRIFGLEKVNADALHLSQTCSNVYISQSQ